MWVGWRSEQTAVSISPMAPFFAGLHWMERSQLSRAILRSEPPRTTAQAVCRVTMAALPGWPLIPAATFMSLTAGTGGLLKVNKDGTVQVVLRSEPPYFPTGVAAVRREPMRARGWLHLAQRLERPADQEDRRVTAKRQFWRL